MKKLIIIGAGGHGRVVADVASSTELYNEIFFLDDDESKSVAPYRLLGKTADFSKYINECDFFVAIGNNDIREKMIKSLEENGAVVTSLVHKSAVIGGNVKIGNGSVVVAGAVVNNGAVIGKGVILNTCSSIDHDCVIGDYTHVAVGAHIAGTVNIGEKCFICAGVTVINNVNVCENCIVGAGATVVDDICESGTYVGVPAKRIK